MLPAPVLSSDSIALSKSLASNESEQTRLSAKMRKLSKLHAEIVEMQKVNAVLDRRRLPKRPAGRAVVLPWPVKFTGEKSK